MKEDNARGSVYLDSATLLRDRMTKSLRRQGMSIETMENQRESDGFFVTRSLAIASGYLQLGTGAVQLELAFAARCGLACTQWR